MSSGELKGMGHTIPSRWRATLVAVTVGAVLGSLAAGVATFGRPNYLTPVTRQPIQFNHSKHEASKALSCASCHEFVVTGGLSRLPTREVCQNCHLTPQGESSEAQRLMDLLTAGAPLVWKPLYRQPPHVYFPHRRHVESAQLECSVCHDGIGTSERPPLQVKRLAMQDCLDCHEARAARTDCTTCHR